MSVGVGVGFEARALAFLMCGATGACALAPRWCVVPPLRPCVVCLPRALHTAICCAACWLSNRAPPQGAPPVASSFACFVVWCGVVCDHARCGAPLGWARSCVSARVRGQAWARNDQLRRHVKKCETEVRSRHECCHVSTLFVVVLLCHFLVDAARNCR